MGEVSPRAAAFSSGRRRENGLSLPRWRVHARLTPDPDRLDFSH